MTSLWDRIKRLFGYTGGQPPQVADPEGDAAAPAPDATSNARYASLGKTSHRLLALTVNPFRTEWIGRVDVIPPASDKRTALIDRGLVLRGFFKQHEIDAFHRVGDAWLRYNLSWQERARVEQFARLGADKAIQAFREGLQQRRATRRAEAAQRRQERADAIAHRRAHDILFLGRDVSTRLNHRTSDEARLALHNLPILHTPADVAAFFGLTIPALRHLAFHHEAPTRTHYLTFTLAKRSGGTRTIHAPMPRLAATQRRLLDDLLYRVPTGEAVHGFVPGRSTVTNARPHVGRDVVVNLDLKDFFPTVTFPRVRGLFESLGYSGAVATILALIATEPPRLALSLGGRTVLAAAGPRALPQGAPSSPTLANLIAGRLDRRLGGLTRNMGWRYTRYADDLTFSAPPGHLPEVGRLIGTVRRICAEEGFQLHPDKGSVLRRAQRQSVTGIVVNDRPGLPRAEVRRLRAILHQARTTGLEAQNREGLPHFTAWLQGRIAYLAMIHPEQAAPLHAQLLALLPKKR